MNDDPGTPKRLALVRTGFFCVIQKLHGHTSHSWSANGPVAAHDRIAVIRSLFESVPRSACMSSTVRAAHVRLMGRQHVQHALVTHPF